MRAQSLTGLEFLMLFWATRTTTWCCIRNSAVFEPDDGAELTHRLLAFARQQVLEPKETHVNDLIVDTGRLISRALGEGIKITTALDSKNPMVMVDQSQLESALMPEMQCNREAL